MIKLIFVQHTRKNLDKNQKCIMQDLIANHNIYTKNKVGLAQLIHIEIRIKRILSSRDKTLNSRWK